MREVFMTLTSTNQSGQMEYLTLDADANLSITTDESQAKSFTEILPILKQNQKISNVIADFIKNAKLKSEPDNKNETYKKEFEMLKTQLRRPETALSGEEKPESFVPYEQLMKPEDFENFSKMYFLYEDDFKTDKVTMKTISTLIKNLTKIIEPYKELFYENAKLDPHPQFSLCIDDLDVFSLLEDLIEEHWTGSVLEQSWAKHAIDDERTKTSVLEQSWPKIAIDDEPTKASVLKAKHALDNELSKAIDLIKTFRHVLSDVIGKTNNTFLQDNPIFSDEDKQIYDNLINRLVKKDSKKFNSLFESFKEAFMNNQINENTKENLKKSLTEIVKPYREIFIRKAKVGRRSKGLSDAERLKVALSTLVDFIEANWMQPCLEKKEIKQALVDEKTSILTNQLISNFRDILAESIWIQREDSE